MDLALFRLLFVLEERIEEITEEHDDEEHVLNTRGGRLMDLRMIPEPSGMQTKKNRRRKRKVEREGTQERRFDGS